MRVSMGSFNNVIVPQSLTVQLKYQHFTAISPTSLTTLVNFSLNSPYDPVYDLSGGNCTGYSQLIALYQFCLVQSVLIRFSAQNTSAAQPAYMFIVPFNSTQSIPTLTRGLVMETPYGRWADLYFGNSAVNPHTITTGYNLRTLEGHSLVPFVDYSCTSSADPTRQLVASIGVSALDGATVGVSGSFTVVLTYNCFFWQKRIFDTL